RLCGTGYESQLHPGPDLGSVVEHVAEDDQDHEVARADPGRGQVAELLPDLATDLETRDGHADETEPEERLLRREAPPVGAPPRRTVALAPHAHPPPAGAH